MRRGELGGDIFRLQSGVLEVVDPTRVPELILNTLAPGAVVGELAFVSDAPRSVDVRAGTACVLLAWDPAALEALFDQHPSISATFHRQVARLTAARLRRITDRAIAGTFSPTTSVDADDDVRTWVHRIVAAVKASMPGLEALVRGSPDDRVTADVFRMLDSLEHTVTELFEAYPDPGAAGFAERELRRELHPYLVRSSLAERALRRPHGRIGTVQILAQAMIDLPLGDGPVGLLVDRWMLDRPTFTALRALQPELVRTIAQGIPDGRPARIQILNVGTGSLTKRLADQIDPLPGADPVTVTVVDQSELALQLVPAAPTGSRVAVNPLRADFVTAAIAEQTLDLPAQDIVVVQHLLELLPERIAVALLRQCRRQLSPDGALVVATLGPAKDRTFLDRILRWPTIRRTRRAVRELLQAAGFVEVTPVAALPPAELTVAVCRG